MEQCWVGRGEPGAGCRDVPAGWEQPVLPVLPGSGKSLQLQLRSLCATSLLKFKSLRAQAVGKHPENLAVAGSKSQLCVGREGRASALLIQSTFTNE